MDERTQNQGCRRAELYRSRFHRAFGLVIIAIFTLTSCTTAPETIPTASATAEPALPTSTPTPEPTPTPIVEPSPISSDIDDLIPVTPPNFETYINLEPGPFDLVDAHAVYAWYRQQVGLRGEGDDFISAMQTYAGELENQGIELKQAIVEGQTFSLLTKGTQILLNFDQNGALKYSDPGYWSPDSTSEWVEAGGPVELFIGDDGHAYIGTLDAEGQVIAYFNPIGATLDNLDSQWIPVEAGRATQQWFGELGWVDASLTAQTDQGPVIVQDGKLYLFDNITQHTQEVSELSAITFDTVADASRIVYALHQETFNDDAQARETILSVGLSQDFRYRYKIDEWVVNGFEYGGVGWGKVLGSLGLPVELVHVKAPSEIGTDLTLSLVMLNVPDAHVPVPFALGVTEATGKFVSLHFTALPFSNNATSYDLITIKNGFTLVGLSEADLWQQAIQDKIIGLGVFETAPSGAASAFELLDDFPEPFFDDREKYALPAARYHIKYLAEPMGRYQETNPNIKWDTGGQVLEFMLTDPAIGGSQRFIAPGSGLLVVIDLKP